MTEFMSGMRTRGAARRMAQDSAARRRREQAEGTNLQGAEGPPPPQAAAGGEDAASGGAAAATKNEVAALRGELAELRALLKQMMTAEGTSSQVTHEEGQSAESASSLLPRQSSREAGASEVSRALRYEEAAGGAGASMMAPQASFGYGGQNAPMSDPLPRQVSLRRVSWQHGAASRYAQKIIPPSTRERADERAAVGSPSEVEIRVPAEGTRSGDNALSKESQGKSVITQFSSSGDVVDQHTEKGAGFQELIVSLRAVSSNLWRRVINAEQINEVEWRSYFSTAEQLQSIIGASSSQGSRVKEYEGADRLAVALALRVQSFQPMLELL